MPLPTAQDPETGVPVSRITSGQGDYLLPYYTAEALSPDGRFLACTRRRDGVAQAIVVDMETGGEAWASELEEGVLDEAVAFHRTRNWVFFGGRKSVWWHDLDSGRTELVYDWETGHVQAEPFCAHGCTHERPFHVHAQFAADEQTVLFNSNWRGQCNIYAAHTAEFLANWQDKAPFSPRPGRNCMPPRDTVLSPKRGPEA